MYNHNVLSIKNKIYIYSIFNVNFDHCYISVIIFLNHHFFMDEDLEFERSEIRVEHENESKNQENVEYDHFALLFLEAPDSKQNCNLILQAFEFISHEMKLKVLHLLFNLSYNDDSSIFYLKIINTFAHSQSNKITKLFANQSIFNDAFNLFNFKCSEPIDSLLEQQKIIIKILSHTIFLQSKVKTDMFYQVIFQFTIKFADKINISKFLISLINHPPFPPSSMINHFNEIILSYSSLPDQSVKKKYNYISYFLYLAKTNMISNYDSLFPLFQSYLKLQTPFITERIFGVIFYLPELNDNIIFFLLESLQDFIDTNSSSQFSISIYLILSTFIKNDENILAAQKSAHFNDILNKALIFLEFDDFKIREKSILIFKYLFSDPIPYNKNVCTAFIENIEISSCSLYIFRCLINWIASFDSLEVETAEEFVSILLENYDKLESLALLITNPITELFLQFLKAIHYMEK